MNFKSLSSKLKGHGSSNFGTIHFIRQRCTALALIPLFCWLLFNIALFVKSSNMNDLFLFLAHPINFVLIMLFVLAFLYHGFLGMDDVMKDYIHCEALYKVAHKALMAICILTYCVTVANLLFYHLLFRYLSGSN
jgi:succinate dehydrogenase / fumarate reductase membrane anchor subunit